MQLVTSCGRQAQILHREQPASGSNRKTKRFHPMIVRLNHLITNYARHTNARFGWHTLR